MENLAFNIDKRNAYNISVLDGLFIWIIALFGVKVYTFLITPTIGKALTLGCFIIVTALLLIHIIYGKRSEVKKGFLLEVSFIFISLIISVFAAYLFYDQSIRVTAFAQYEFYIFLFYFLIHRLRPDPDKILTMCVWLGYGYTIVYFLQYLAYPTEITSSKAISDRGSIRILIPGSEFMVTGWFIQLTRYFITKKIKYIIALFPYLVIIILLATRQVMAGMALITIYGVISSKTLKSKAWVLILIIISVIPFYFLFQEVFTHIFEVSQRDSDNFSDDIRVIAAKYFLFELNPNPVWIITGNGMPGPHTSYGQFLHRLAEELGYYQSDVGIIGSFSRFGIFFALGELLIVGRLALRRFDEKLKFVKYNALLMLMTMFTGAGLKASTIILLCFMMYVTDLDTQQKRLN